MDEAGCPHCGAVSFGRAAVAVLLGLSLATGCEAGGKAIALYGAMVTTPEVTITAPADGATVSAGDVEIDATVVDSDASDLTTLDVAWAVDDAAVCADATVDASGDTTCVPTLSAGDHTVTVTVSDPEDMEPGEASITLHVTADTGG